MRVVREWNDFDEIPELSQETEADPRGYMSIKDTVESFIRAGERLQEIRDDLYDFNNEKEAVDYEGPIDSTRSKGYDLADYATDTARFYQMLSWVEKRMADDDKKAKKAELSAKEATKETRTKKSVERHSDVLEPPVDAPEEN